VFLSVQVNEAMWGETKVAVKCLKGAMFHLDQSVGEDFEREVRE
jgi:hypothetical protein